MEVMQNTQVDDIAQPDSGQQVMFNMEAMIKSHLTARESLKIELAEHRDMLADILKNDPTYQEHDGNAKEAIRIRTATKNQILKRPDCADLSEKAKSLRVQLRENKDSTSDYAKEYNRMSGVNEIEGEDGQLYLIVMEARIIKKSEFN